MTKRQPQNSNLRPRTVSKMAPKKDRTPLSVGKNTSNKTFVVLLLLSWDTWHYEKVKYLIWLFWAEKMSNNRRSITTFDITQFLTVFFLTFLQTWKMGSNCLLLHCVILGAFSDSEFLFTVQKRNLHGFLFPEFFSLSFEVLIEIFELHKWVDH